METKTKVTVKTIVNRPVSKVWKVWSSPEHITKWNAASDDWHTPKAENDLRAGGNFNNRMEAKDGSFGFDLKGTYSKVEENKLIAFSLEDARTVEVRFEEEAGKTIITETFEAEGQNPVEMQKAGWQAILDNFKKYAEALS
jgi:uncharacterized protein YndB with AHSA1/START domain